MPTPTSDASRRIDRAAKPSASAMRTAAAASSSRDASTALARRDPGPEVEVREPFGEQVDGLGLHPAFRRAAIALGRLLGELLDDEVADVLTHLLLEVGVHP